MNKRRTVCNRDCPDACHMEATIEEGRVVRLAGAPDHPVTKGFLCHRTSRFLERQYSPERLSTPLVREGQGFRAVSWEEALDLVARRLIAIRAESGPAAILHYGSVGSMGKVKALVHYFFELFGPVSSKHGDMCSGAGDAAQIADFGEEEGHDIFDLLQARNILIWGRNPTVSWVHLLPVLRQARDQGAKLTLIDPIRHRTEHICQRTILPRPGGDAALAMGVAAWLMDGGLTDPLAPDYCDGFDDYCALAMSRSVGEWAAEADVTVEEVEALGAALADRPCCILVGWGMARRANGFTIVRALDALGGISGNVGLSGGGVSYFCQRHRAFDTSFLSKRYPRTLSEPLLGRELAEAKDPPIRAVFVTGANPVTMLPDSAAVARALETRELVVVVDSFMTDTARRATVVLPTTTMLEEEDLLGAYGHHWLGSSRPVVEAPDGVRSDLEIVQALAGRIDGLTGSSISDKLAGTAREWKRRMLSAEAGLSLEDLEAGPTRNPLARQVLWPDRKFPTDTGRMKLLASLAPGPPDEPDYPLWLFTNSSIKSQASQWAGDPPREIEALCHPDAAPGLSSGDEVLIESALGRLRARLRLDPGQRRDTVVVPKGGYLDHGACANALVPARITDGGEGAAYLDCRVRIVGSE